MEIEIQPITLRHAMAVQKLSQQLGYALFLNEVENNIKEVILSTDHIALVAVVDGEVAGWIHAFKAIFLESNPFVEVGGLVVDENYRSQGIGKKLVEQIKQWCTEQKISTLRVRSQVKRKEAHQFYLNNGFSEIKEQKVFQINL
ncbi:MAG TPA: GNAT family N-acetyltransferase [Flavisolibacter sp.]|jgi:GNAT superfamily N-acetyltransferase|nr:GNAT family N-acetyltransferase [Flavisolibacter sp.]